MEKRMNEPIVPASVERVCVFENGCVITCSGEVELEQGENTIMVDCLPDATDEDSIRVRMTGGVSLRSVSVVRPVGKGPSEQEQALEQCKRKIKRIDKYVDNRLKQKDLWLSCMQRIQASQESVQAVESYLTNLSVHIDALDDELAEFENQSTALRQELEGLQKAIEETTKHDTRGLLCLKLVTTAAGLHSFETDIRSRAAAWNPVYDVLVDGFTGPVQLRMRAEVVQRTGLEWNDVQLVLSTASPASQGTLPRIQPLKLRKSAVDPNVSVHMVDAVSLSSSRTIIAMDSSDAQPKSPMVNLASPDAAEVRLANSVQYDIPGAWSIHSGVDSVTVEIQTLSLGASYLWHAVPSLADTVYIVAQLDDPLPQETMGVDASVYIEGEFCGKVTLDGAHESNGSYQLSLGQDTRMRTTRRLVSRNKLAKLLRGRTVEQMVYELELKSSRNETSHVALVDQVPVSEHKDIEVEISECSGGRLNDETGELRWELEVLPLSSIKKRFEYSVSYPKDVQVEWVTNGASGLHTPRVWREQFCWKCGTVMNVNDQFCSCCGARMR